MARIRLDLDERAVVAAEGAAQVQAMSRMNTVCILVDKIQFNFEKH